MPEIETITVRLKYSKVGAEANINASDFDPEKHARMDEVWPPPDTPSPPPIPESGMPARRRGGEPTAPITE